MKTIKYLSFPAVITMTMATTGTLGYFAASWADTGTPSEQVIKVSSRRFAFSPNVITLKKGVPVVLEFTSDDVLMGFNSPDFESRVDIVPGQVSRVHLNPDKIGTFTFLCDVFCGSGHENMNGVIKVVE
jgi:cytochrome c oxidase subunit 2